MKGDARAAEAQREYYWRRARAISDGAIHVDMVPCSFCGGMFKPRHRTNRCCSSECGLNAKTRAGRENRGKPYPMGADILRLSSLFGWDNLSPAELAEAERQGITRYDAEAAFESNREVA